MRFSVFKQFKSDSLSLFSHLAHLAELVNVFNGFFFCKSIVRHRCFQEIIVDGIHLVLRVCLFNYSGNKKTISPLVRLKGYGFPLERVPILIDFFDVIVNGVLLSSEVSCDHHGCWRLCPEI